MGFQIHNKEGQPVKINDLDLEARHFWHGTSQDHVYEKYKTAYTVPEKVVEGMSSFAASSIIAGGNWFDIVGYNIHSNDSVNRGCDGEITWDMVKESIALVHLDAIEAINAFEGLEKTDTDEGIQEFLNGKTIKSLLIKLGASYLFVKPYFNLIDYWESKGYKPVKV